MSASPKIRAKAARPAARKARSAGRTQSDRNSGDETDGGQTETVSLFGDLHGGLTQIRASNVRLVLTFGEYSRGRDVLIPLVDWQIYGHQVSAGVGPDPDDKGPLLNSRLLSFDNLAFLLQDLSYDTREAVRLLIAQSTGGVPPVEERTRYTARMLRLASKHLSTAAEQMENLLEQE